MLITINLKQFEVISHEMEYLNEFTMTLFDATVLSNLVQGRSHQQSSTPSWMAIFTLICATIIALVQLGIYNLSGWTVQGPKGEKPAHYMEFIFSLLSAVVTFWFTMDNKMSADRRLNQIMHGPADDVSNSQ
mmetsp:Transcript_52559/g.92284  ORF Transcript_52559/g.92284 Transcript_52559/m.92284 type:complete len:132 (+) Transcript_52559:2-397(+)